MERKKLGGRWRASAVPMPFLHNKKKTAITKSYCCNSIFLTEFRRGVKGVTSAHPLYSSLI